MNRLAAGSRLREAGFTATWAAGLTWLVVAMLSAGFAVVFAITILGIPVALVAAIGGVMIPLSLVSGMWGYRNRWAAALGAFYSFAPAAVMLANGQPLLALIVAVPGLFSALAVGELGSARLPPPGSF